MATPIQKREARLRERRTDRATGRVILAKRYDESFGRAPQDANLVYLLGCAEPVSDEYTRKTYDECERVQNQVQKALDAASILVDFDHQGSVTNNTHIKLHSDIDLLVLPTGFVHVKAPLTAANPYRGNPVKELATIRRICEQSLAAEFYAAEVDTNGGKCVSIRGGSLARKVDVVPASWVHTREYVNARVSDKAYAKRFKGINVLDKGNMSLIQNFPFLHNARIDERDRESNGNLRRLIRVVKSIRSDADEPIGVSSYHITGLCYALPPEQLEDDIKVTLHRFIAFALDLLKNKGLRDALWVPNATEKLFANIDTSELLKLLGEAVDLIQDKAA